MDVQAPHRGRKIWERAKPVMTLTGMVMIFSLAVLAFIFSPKDLGIIIPSAITGLTIFGGGGVLSQAKEDWNTGGPRP